jgi:hypothetical protein
MGSATEVECLLLVARDLSLVETKAHRVFETAAQDVNRMLNGLLAKLELTQPSASRTKGKAASA